MSRIKIVITTVHEYEVDPTNYPTDMDLAAMMETDRANAEEDPMMFMEAMGVVTTVTAEVV